MSMNANPDTISVVMPAYNAGMTVEAALRSLLAQTYAALEVIVVDDGSTDDTPAILARAAAADGRVRVIRQANAGVTAARLRGLGAVTGRWVGFMDADDGMDEAMLERLHENAVQYGADIAHCGYRMVFPSRVDYYGGTGEIAVHDRKAGLRRLLAGKTEPGLWNKLFRRELTDGLLRFGGMDDSVRVNEDLLMNFYLFRMAEKSVYEDVCPYAYIVRPGSAAASRDRLCHYTDPVRVWETLYSQTADNPALRGLALAGLARRHIRLASMDVRANPAALTPLRSSSRRRLRALLPALRREPDCGARLVCEAHGAAALPGLYGAAKRTFARVTGRDRRYEIA